MVRPDGRKRDRSAHVLTDLDGVFLSVDDAYCEILAMDRSQIVGSGAVQFTSPAERAAHVSAIDRLRSTGEPLVIRKSYVRSDLKLIKVENSVSVISDGIGPNRMVATVQPLSDDTPVSRVEGELAVAEFIANEHYHRNSKFGHDHFSGDKWSILIACHIRECRGLAAYTVDTCADAKIDPTSGLILILDLIVTGDLQFEHVGAGLDDSTVALSNRTRSLLAEHIARFLPAVPFLPAR